MPPTRRKFLSHSAALAASGTLVGLSGCDQTSPDINDINAAPDNRTGVFAHGVASGDPMADRVILWTRLSQTQSDAPVTWVLATDPQLTNVVRSSGDGVDAAAQARATMARDYTVKLDVTGLQPGTTYYYQFSALGQQSPIGRTRTAPETAEQLRFAVCSCSKYHQAYWNSYAHIAKRRDLDAVLHCGDYIYEETEKGSAIPGRNLDDNIEIYTLTEYRARHAFYKTDPDLQEMHRQHPIIAVWDDHEVADNCWYGGAHRHDEAEHGPWEDRRAAAVTSYDEWMPIRTQATPDGKNIYERIYRGLSYGDLAHLIAIDGRLIGRDQEVPSLTSDDPQPSNPNEVNDPNRTLLGEVQRNWFLSELSDTAARWKVVINPFLIGQLHAAAGQKNAGGGQIVNGDQWDGYRADQNRVIEHIRNNDIDNVVFVTGDIHSSWVIDVTDDPHNPAVYQRDDGLGNPPPEPLRAVAVEFVTPGIGSGASSQVADFADGLQGINPHIKHIEATQRGYFLLDLDTQRAQAEWYYANSVTEPNPAMSPGQIWLSRAAINHTEQGDTPSAEKPDAPALAP